MASIRIPSVKTIEEPHLLIDIDVARETVNVEASGSATVEASGSATVRASGSATAISPIYSRSKVTILGHAVHVDRRAGGKPVVTIGDGE